MHVYLLLRRYYLAILFENDRHFSHLGEMEREMSFRSETGFYYSFYKNLVDSPSFVDGVRGLLKDNRTEFGHEINDLKRFNLYPEIVAAVLFRTYRSLTRYFDYETEVCWTTFRGENVSTTTSCEGLGNKFYFYVNVVFALGGLLASLLFLFGYLLSDSILGGVLTAVCFLFNHGQATRTMWAPSLRECFGYPIFLLLMLVLTAIVKANHVTSFRTVLVAFALLTERVFSKRSILGAIVKVLLFCVGTVALKILIARLCSVTDDAHIFELLKSKLLGEHTFHTYLYLCMVEFGFLPTKDIVEMSRSLLLPASMFVLLAAFKVFVTSTLFTGKGSTRWPIRSYAAVYYTCIQLSCFLVMAGLVMRLKLFFTPHMCIICSLVFNPTFLSDVFGRPVSWRRSVIFGLLLAILMSVYGVIHVQKELSIKGEFSDLKQEELLMWIKKNTSPDAVFAGQMPIMSSVMLSAGRPIVAHPHYEDAALRERVKILYQMFSRKPVAQVHKAVASTGAHYLIIERNYCFDAKPGAVRNECYFSNAWDYEDPDNLGNSVCCSVMQKNPAPFKQVYQSGVFMVFKV
ncbi:protein dpy 19 1 [Trichuris trichiura]|uniref:Protein dpy 19 1 n=1 Tax=Trichuris trichiura TaxID=36087 RepID=A0A077Z4D1_TRITR|nr:protein dpy 19 1 [Trichuris trichiura]